MTRSPTPVVIDTNLVLSALIFQNGRVAALRHLWQSGAIVPLISRETTLELVRALAYPKFRLTQAEQEELLRDYLPWCKTVDIPNTPLQLPECRDPHDLPFLALALAGEAHALITGDNDLLNITDTFSIPILTASIFLQQRGD